MSEPSREVWFMVKYRDFVTLLERAVAGEDPETIAMELFVNCEHLDTGEL
jgi:hypothetical protein